MFVCCYFIVIKLNKTKMEKQKHYKLGLKVNMIIAFLAVSFGLPAGYLVWKGPYDPLDPNVPPHSVERKKQEIYRAIDALGDQNGRVSDLEQEIFLKTVSPSCPDTLSKKHVLDWTEQETDYILRRFQGHRTIRNSKKYGN